MMTGLFATPDPEVLLLDQQPALWLWHDVLAQDEKQLANLCADLSWQQPQLLIYGKRHLLPRLQSWHGDRAYRYSGKLFQPEPWNATLLAIKSNVEALTGHTFNSVLCNLYRDGDDHMGWHADDEPELGASPWIASLSLGAERDFCLRRKGTGNTGLRVALPHNSLLLMAPFVQQQWQHALPTRRRVKEARLNLTFRHILS